MYLGSGYRCARPGVLLLWPQPPRMLSHSVTFSEPLKRGEKADTCSGSPGCIMSKRTPPWSLNSILSGSSQVRLSSR